MIKRGKKNDLFNHVNVDAIVALYKNIDTSILFMNPQKTRKSYKK